MPQEEDPYDWRVRVDVRSAVNVPLNLHRVQQLPSTKVEIAWSESIRYESVKPIYCQRSLIVTENRFPNWNQQMLLVNPPGLAEPTGFVWITVLEGEGGDDQVLEQFYVPVTFFQSFKPVHLEVRCREIEPTTVSSRPTIYLSLCLETKEVGFLDSVCTLIVNWADFDPMPYESRYCNFVVSTGDSRPEYQVVDLKDEQSVARAFQKTN